MKKIFSFDFDLMYDQWNDPASSFLLFVHNFII